jgi:hypothetical protein
MAGTRKTTRFWWAVVLIGFPGAVSAQQTGSGGWGELRPVEPGFSDASPLSLDTRQMPLDLRMDLDFERVYAGKRTSGQRWFARRHAGVTAVFPRSVYASTDSGALALVPPDTTFVIGEPSGLLASKLGLRNDEPGGRRDFSGGLRIDGRIDEPVERTPIREEPHARHAEEDSARRGIAALLRMAGTRERRGW